MSARKRRSRLSARSLALTQYEFLRPEDMNDLQVAITVAEEGAAVVRQRFGTTLQRLDKGAVDFATNADIEAENAMLAVLHRERPDDAILGEEVDAQGRETACEHGW